MQNSVDGPIVNRFKWTRDEVFEGQRALARCRGGGFVPQSLKIILLGAIVLVLMRVLKLGWDMLIIYFALVGFCFFFIPSLNRLLARKSLAARQGKDLEWEWEIWPDRLVGTNALNRREITWDSLHKVLQCPFGFLLYFAPRMFQWLPARGFQRPGDIERFASIARSRVKRFQHKSSS